MRHLAEFLQIRSTARTPVSAIEKDLRLGKLGKSIHRALVVAAMLVLSTAAPRVAQPQTFSPEAVKAAFLHRFASYVEWPPDALGDGPFVIAVVGSEQVSEHLGELLPRMTLQGRRAEVRSIDRGTDLDGVHILYISTDMLARTRELRAAAAQLAVLLVTDGDVDFDDGGVINFLETGGKVQFEVSLTAADRARLRIDSALLAVAARVEQPDGGPGRRN
jgi:hypothetical protein